VHLNLFWCYDLPMLWSAWDLCQKKDLSQCANCDANLPFAWSLSWILMRFGLFMGGRSTPLEAIKDWSFCSVTPSPNLVLFHGYILVPFGPSIVYLAVTHSWFYLRTFLPSFSSQMYCAYGHSNLLIHNTSIPRTTLWFPILLGSIVLLLRDFSLR